MLSLTKGPTRRLAAGEQQDRDDHDRDALIHDPGIHHLVLLELHLAWARAFAALKIFGHDPASEPLARAHRREGGRACGARLRQEPVGASGDPVAQFVRLERRDATGRMLWQQSVPGLPTRFGTFNAKYVAGTGTIEANGKVGPIGGIVQKMYAAKGAGATVFLAPSANCAETLGKVPSGLKVYRISKLNTAVELLTALQAGSSLSGFATCDK